MSDVPLGLVVITIIIILLALALLLWIGVMLVWRMETMHDEVGRLHAKINTLLRDNGRIGHGPWADMEK